MSCSHDLSMPFYRFNSVVVLDTQVFTLESRKYWIGSKIRLRKNQSFLMPTIVSILILDLLLPPLTVLRPRPMEAALVISPPPGRTPAGEKSYMKILQVISVRIECKRVAFTPNNTIEPMAELALHVYSMVKGKSHHFQLSQFPHDEVLLT